MVSRDSCLPSSWVIGWPECMQEVGTAGWGAGPGPTMVPSDGAVMSLSLPTGLFPSYPHITLNIDGPKAVPLVPAPIYTSLPTIAQVSSVPFSIVWLKRCPVQPQI